VFIHPERHLSCLGCSHSSSDVSCDSAQLGVGHEAARTEDASHATYQGHHIRCSDSFGEVYIATLDSLHQVFGPNDVSPCLKCLLGKLAFRKHRNNDALPGSMRKLGRTSYILPWFSGVNI